MHRDSNRNGSVVAELAITCPVLVLIVLATISVCNLFFLKQSLTIAAYEAARVALIPAATNQDVELQAMEICECRSVQGANVAISPVDFQTVSSGNFITVTVSAPSQQSPLETGLLNGITQASVSIMKE